MGFFRAIKERRDRKLYEEALRVMDPYVFLPQRGEVMWFRWSLLASAEKSDIFSEPEGLPVLMTMEECLAANSDCGILPPYWGEVQHAWRNEAQKQAFYAKYPERFNRKAVNGKIPGTKTMIDCGPREPIQGLQERYLETVKPQEQRSSMERRGYPTREEIQEHLEAYKKGGTALEDLLERRRKEAQTSQPQLQGGPNNNLRVRWMNADPPTEDRYTPKE
jgi:hypothetical protein